MKNVDSSSPWREPWRIGFIAGLLTVAAAFAFLIWATFEHIGEEPASASPPSSGPTATATTPPHDAPDGTTVWAEPPIEVPLGDDSGLRLIEARDEADIVVTRNDGPGGVVWRHYVPVTSFYTGVDELTRDELRAIFAGEISDWSEVGGIPGPVTLSLVLDDEGTVQDFLGLDDLPLVRFHNDYGELLEAMTPDAGAIALVPLELVHPGVTAVALDGVDIVRGRGDPASWPFVERVQVTAQTEEGDGAAAAVAEVVRQPPPEAASVAVTGDILPTRCSLTQIEATGDYAASLRGEMGEFLASADLTMGTLDTSIQDFSQPLGCSAHVNLSAPPDVIELFHVGGFDTISVASNHIFDCGAQGFCGSDAFLRTIELLEEAGVATVGGGTNLEEALEAVVFEISGTSFGVLAFDDVAAMHLGAGPDTPGTAPLDDDYREELASGEAAFFRPAEELSLERFSTAIEQLNAQVDVVIVLVQSGTEDTHTPSPRSLKALRQAVDSGAGLVIGNQAHHVQAAEVRDGVFIAYALGNFIYDQVHTPEHTQGYVVEATFWGPELVNIRMLPYQIEEMYRPVFVEGELRTKILGDVFTAGAELPEE